MFGYINVYKEIISEADYELFKAYYCGLCKAMGKHCSHITRLGLSYDITFLALVLSSVSADASDKEVRSCIAHPLKKREYIINDDAINYAADMGVILTYLKFSDDLRDERSIKALIGMLAFHRGMKKASKRNGGICKVINEQLARLSGLEEQKSESIDECADCFAKILEALFTPEFITDDSQRRVLAWLGYNIGRWIYVIDAVNDMEKDHRSGDYNTFNASFSGGDFHAYMNKIRKEKEITLTFTLENAASAFELLDIKKNKALIEKIIYDCLKTKQSQILSITDNGENVPY